MKEIIKTAEDKGQIFTKETGAVMYWVISLTLSLSLIVGPLNQQTIFAVLFLMITGTIANGWAIQEFVKQDLRESVAETARHNYKLGYSEGYQDALSAGRTQAESEAEQK